MNNEKTKLQDVDPAEDLHKIGLKTEKMVGDTWVNERVQPALITNDDRKTGKVSDESTNKLREGTLPTNMG